MSRINNLKLKTLKMTKKFYLFELKKKGITENERSKFLEALVTINKIINEKEKSGEKKNLFLKPNGGIDLIEKFPVYKDRKK